MALAEQVKSTPPRRTGLPCSIGELERDLPPAELEAFHHMMYAERWSAVAIYDALVKEKRYVGRQQINRHRNGACRCEQAAR